MAREKRLRCARLQFARVQPEGFGQPLNGICGWNQLVVFDLGNIPGSQSHPVGQCCDRNFLPAPGLGDDVAELVF